jgi:beta-lactamase class C
MATFLQLQMGAMNEVLTPQDLADFHAPITLAPDAVGRFQGLTSGNVKSYYGQGWRIVDYSNGRLIFHGGWIKGVGNFLGFLPAHNVGIVILHNAESGFSFRTAMMFFDQCVKKK